VFKIAESRAAREAYDALPTLNMLRANVERDNLVRMRSTMVAKNLRVSQATVDRHISKLRKLGIIEPDQAEGDKKIGIFNWRICPFLVWKGCTDTMRDYLETLPEEHSWRSYNKPTIFSTTPLDKLDT
jgi:DNA-binding transcriptional ArsR family regulator